MVQMNFAFENFYFLSKGESSISTTCMKNQNHLLKNIVKVPILITTWDKWEKYMKKARQISPLLAEFSCPTKYKQKVQPNKTKGSDPLFQWDNLRLLQKCGNPYGAHMMIIQTVHHEFHSFLENFFKSYFNRSPSHQTSKLKRKPLNTFIMLFFSFFFFLFYTFWVSFKQQNSCAASHCNKVQHPH